MQALNNNIQDVSNGGILGTYDQVEIVEASTPDHYLMYWTGTGYDPSELHPQPGHPEVFDVWKHGHYYPASVTTVHYDADGRVYGVYNNGSFKYKRSGPTGASYEGCDTCTFGVLKTIKPSGNVQDGITLFR